MTLFNLLSKYTTLEEMPRFANRQGVAGLLYQEVIESGENPGDKRWIMRLSGFVQKRQKRYHVHKEKMEKLARFYGKHGIGMMVLKGYGLSLNWPVPDYRQPGDLDIFLFDKGLMGEEVNGLMGEEVNGLMGEEVKGLMGEKVNGLRGDEVWKRADRLVEEKLGVKVDDSHEHHTCFSLGDLSVENHYDFNDVKLHRDGKVWEEKFKELAREGLEVRDERLEVRDEGLEIGGESNIYFPSANLNALFLMRHMGLHFANTFRSLRQVYDWAFFVDKHTEEVDWKMVMEFVDNMGNLKFFHQMNAICVDYLGIDEKKFPKIDRDVVLEKRLLDYVMMRDFSIKEDERTSMMGSLKRYFSNVWVRKLIFKDGPFFDFLWGVRAKLGKKL